MLSLRTIRRTTLLPFGLLCAAFLAGCASPTGLLPSTPQAQSIYNLLIVLVIVGAVVFVVVEGLLLYTVLRFSHSGGQGESHDTSRRLEVAWTAAPAIVLAVLFSISAVTLYFLTTQGVSIPGVSAPAPGTEVNLRAVGHQWWWEFDYDDQHIVTAGEMHVPAGALIKVGVQSVDVIHSFWVPELGGKTDAIPGQTNHTMFAAAKAGVYLGECSEFCGVEHAGMLFSVVVEPLAAFEQWVRQQQAPPAVMTGPAAKGEAVFMAGICGACHAINGSSARGKRGPNLTHLASRSAIAGGVVPNTPDNLTQWLQDPQKVKPGNNMIIPKLSDDDIESLVDYLTNLK